MKQLPPIQKNAIPNKGYKEALNIFLIQNKGKGPPGGWDSPGAGFISLPDYLVALCKGSQSIKTELKQIIQYQFTNLFHN